MDTKELRREIVSALRAVGLDGQRIGDAFAQRNGLNATDLRAMVLVMEAESGGAPLSAGQLGRRLGTTSGATTAVIDRLERVGHIRRNRTHADRRRVTLHFEPQARALAAGFFGPLGVLADRIMDGYSEPELRLVNSFLQSMHQAYQEHLAIVSAPDTASGAEGAERAANRVS